MIPWFQCTAFELKAISNLPNKLRKRFVTARELQLVRELDTLPGFTESELIELESTGIATRLEILCPRLLKERDRQVRKKTKEEETATRVAPVSDTVPTRARPVQTERQSREEKTDRQTDAPPAHGMPAKVKKAVRRQAEETPLPEDWEPSEEHAKLAAKQRLNLEYQADAFRIHARATDRRAKSWNGAFATWLLKGDPAKEPRHLKEPQDLFANLTAPAGALRYAQLKAEGKVS